MDYQNKWRVVYLLWIYLSLFACSGDDGPIGTGDQPLQVQGTVAIGTAIPGSTVTIKDSDGNTDTTTTNRNGTYQFNDVNDLKPPFLLKVQLGNGTSLFSVAMGAGRANIHPLTDIVVRNWYKSNHNDRELEDAFDDDGPIITPLIESEIQATLDVIESLLRLAYLKFGIDADFDFLRHQFYAKYVNSNGETVDGSEFDLLLDHIKVEIEDNKITIKLVNPNTGIVGTIIVKFDLEDDLTQQDTEKPSEPTGFTIIPGGSNSLVLLWNSSIDNVGIAGYNIYKGDNTTLLDTSPYPVFVDTFDWLVDTEYCYYIQAFDAADNQSAKVKKCFIDPSDSDETAPLPPSNLVVTNLGSFANNISWTPSPDDVIGYDLYRDINDANNFVKVSTVIASNTDDLGLLPNTKYCYYTEAIKVINIDGGTSYGTIRSVPSNIDCVTTVDTTVGDTTPPVTTASPMGGTYASAQTVTLSCIDTGGSGCAAIYFSFDGSDPSTLSLEYVNPIIIDRTTTLKYFAIDVVGNVESFHTQVYTITNGATLVTKTPMPTKRLYLTSSAVNGKIYAIGGWYSIDPSDGATYTFFNTVEVYDPTTDSWTTKTPMPTERGSHTSSVVNGKIYVIGGNNNWTPSNTVEEYDPTTDTWTTKSPMPTVRWGHTANMVNGIIYVMGGTQGSLSNNISLNTVEAYDPTTDTWTTMTPMPTGRHIPKSSVINGEIYVIGGTNSTSNPIIFLNTVELYNPANDSWTTRTSVSITQGWITTTVVNGNIYLFGKLGTELYNPSSNSWSTITTSFADRFAASSVEFNGKIYIIGGAGSGAEASGINTVEEYDPNTSGTGILNNAWSTKTPMPTVRHQFTKSVVNGKIYAIGGLLTGNARTNIVEEYNPTTDSWTTKTPMPTARNALTSGVVNGKIYAIGGTDGSSILDTVEEYDPVTDMWTTKTPIPTARVGMSGSVVNGKIYMIAGSSNILADMTRVDEYDPATDSWTSKTPMPTPRYAMVSSEFNGKIYVIGGWDGTDLDVVEEYDPVTDSWTTKTPMPTARWEQTYGVVNGRIYVIGGGTGTAANRAWLNVVEEYNPLTDSWVTKTPMPTARSTYVSSYTEVNGRIYVIGGWNFSGYLNTVEEYR